MAFFITYKTDRDSSLTTNNVILTTARKEESLPNTRKEESLPNTTLVAHCHSEVQSTEESSVERCYFCRVMLF